MSDTPERITATFNNWRNPNAGACYKSEFGDTAYIRADTVQAQIDAAVKAERERCAERFANHDFICMKHYAKGWRHDVYDAIRKGEQPWAWTS
jgi:hypothetical protein